MGAGAGIPGISDIIQVTNEGIGKLVGAVELIKGHKQQKQDEAELSKLSRPFMQIQDEYIQNRNLAAGQAQQGIPQSTLDYVTNKNDQGLSTAIDYLKQAGGSPNDIAKLFSTYSNSVNATGAQDAAMHSKNIEYFMSANKDLAGQKTNQFVVNELQPYEEKLKQITQNIAADKQNQVNGVNAIIGSGTATATTLSNAGLNNGNSGGGDFYSKLFSTPSNSDVPFKVTGAPAWLGNYQDPYLTERPN